jgi:hypothetical protein
MKLVQLMIAFAACVLLVSAARREKGLRENKKGKLLCNNRKVEEQVARNLRKTYGTDVAGADVTCTRIGGKDRAACSVEGGSSFVVRCQPQSSKSNSRRNYALQMDLATTTTATTTTATTTTMTTTTTATATASTAECQNPCHDFTGSNPTQKEVCDQFGFTGSSMPIWYSEQPDCNAVDDSSAFSINCTDDGTENGAAGAIKYAVCV